MTPELDRSLRLLAAEYPAHLHVNVEESFRGAGVGRGLVERFLAELRAAGVAGVHLHCGPAPVGFYETLGFAELSSFEARPGARVSAMGLKL